MKTIEKNLNTLRLLEKELNEIVLAKSNLESQAFSHERAQRMQTVNPEKGFSNLLNDTEVLDVFIRLRDK